MSNSINVFSTACFPPISYFFFLFNSNNVIIDVGENYIRQTYRNRYKILTTCGVKELIVPIINNHNKTSVKNIKISYNTDWQNIHLKTINTNYNKSPYYIFYKNYFDVFFLKKYDTLIDFNNYFLELIIKLFKMNVNITMSDNYINIDNNNESYIDFRNSFNPKKDDISKSLVFPPYTQVFSAKHNFIKNLSIIDLLFNLGPDLSKYMTSIKII